MSNQEVNAKGFYLLSYSKSLIRLLLASHEIIA